VNNANSKFNDLNKAAMDQEAGTNPA